MIKSILIFLIYLCVVTNFWREARAAAFQNLGFETVITPLIPNDPWGYNRVPASQAFPGWTPYIGATPQSLVLYNANFVSSAGITLAGLGDYPLNWTVPNIIQGNYSALLASGVRLSDGRGNETASLGQVGLVPSDANYLFVRAQAPYGSFTVSLDGQPLDLVPMLVAPNFTRYMADISQFAGREAELRISSTPVDPRVGLSLVWVDAIIFSPVPEPGPIELLVAAVAALGLTRGFRHWRR